MEPFIQLGIILVIVLGVSAIMRLLKQPLIIGYILSGILVGPLFLNILSNSETLSSFSQLGISFLLFIVGLHLSPKVIKEVGKISLITGIGQVVFTSIIGYLIGLFLGYSWLTSLYIAVALTFSSTIIIMKLLSDKGDLEKLYGKISIGFLLVQDLIAIIFLIGVSSFSGGFNAIESLSRTLLFGIISLIILIPISIFILPRLSYFFARSQEFLFLFAISWGLGLSILFLNIGLSLEVGALIAGIMLSISPYHYEISSKLKPLRDFFIISFFIILGSQMIIEHVYNYIIPATIFSVFILIGNPLIVLLLMRQMGYSKKTGFMAGLTVAQISEFSLILIALGVKVGHISPEILSFVTLIGLVTIAGSTYMIIYSEKIYKFISNYLNIFEKKNLKEKTIQEKSFDIVLIGYHRIGYNVLESIKKMKKSYVVVDYNPRVLKDLASKNIPCIYGDIENVDFLDEIKMENAKLIISTVPDKEVNSLLVKKVREKNKDAIIIVTAEQPRAALDFYSIGADYVIIPHHLGGYYASKLIEDFGINRKKYNQIGKKHYKELDKAKESSIFN